MSWKKWYVENGIGILFLGCILLAISYIVGYVYETITRIEVTKIPNHPLAFVSLFGFLLICIGAGSMPFAALMDKLDVEFV